MSELKLVTRGNTDIVVTRFVAAAPELVFRAHIEPELIQQWMLGPEGWSMPRCEVDARVGGAFRYDWVKGDQGFYLTGEYLELEPSSRIVHVERMHMPHELPANTVTTTFEAVDDGTRITMVMETPSEEVRRMMIETGMAMGMEASYARLDRLPVGLAARV